MRLCAVAVVCLLGSATQLAAEEPGSADWPGVGNDPGCMRYSELGQINRENVARLKTGLDVSHRGA